MARFQIVLFLCFLVTAYGDNEKNDNWIDEPLGGVALDSVQYPFICKISTQPSVDSIFCGCTILTSKTIVTAASCFDNIENGTAMYVHSSAKPENFIKIESFLKHAKYNKDTRVEDIAVAYLEEKMKLGEQIRAAFFDINLDALPNTTGTVFGLTKGTGVTSKKIIVTEDDDCAAQWEDTTGKQFCAYGEDGKGIGFAHGFPYIYKNMKTETDYLVGIGSFTGKDTSKPTVFTDVADYGWWILPHSHDKF